MSIINRTYFEAYELRIGQISSVEVRSKVNQAIDSREPEYLRLVLGLPVYRQLQAAIDALPAPTPPNEYKDLTLLPQPWNALVNGADFTAPHGYGSSHLEHWVGLASPEDKRNAPSAKYVYFYYNRSESTFLTGSGATVPKLENGSRVSVAPLQRYQWNSMVELNEQLFRYMRANIDLFPDWPYYSYGWGFPERIRRIHTEFGGLIRPISPLQNLFIKINDWNI